MKGHNVSTVASHRRGLGKLGVLVGLSLSGFFLALAIWPSERSPVPRALEISSASRDSSSAFKPIEKLRVGDRVLTGLASDNLCETSVDERTWKKVTITAVGIWPDGTIDKHSIVTLQPPEWLIANDARVGAEVPLPLDLIEMGGPTDLRGRVDSIEPCPPISRKPGRVVLTTVNHLNNACRELTLRDSQGNVDTIKTTDWHPFWSESRQDWVKAAHLHDGELLQGKAGEPLTLIGSNRIQGVHTVFNMTVESEHVYRVGRFACFVHNQNCHTDDQRALLELIDEATMGGRKPLPVSSAESALDLADEVGLPSRAGPGDVGFPSNWHGGRPPNIPPGQPHIHIPGSVNGGHIPVHPGVSPR
jgi:hypothetical protein